MTVSKIQCVVTHQWLKLHLSNFHMFNTNSLPSRPTHVGTCLIQSTQNKKLTKMAGNFADWFLYGGGQQDGGFKILKRNALGGHVSL